MSERIGTGVRVLVCGGRYFANRGLLERTLANLAKTSIIDAVIEGNARGADRLAGYWARKRGILNLKFNADWDAYGKAAGPIRNARMIKEGKPDLVIAFSGGSGTANMKSLARKAGIEVVEIAEPGDG